MTQCVDYEPFPGMRPENYVPTLRSVITHLAQDADKDFKSFRAHMRSLRIWDKARSPRMLDLVEIRWDRDRVTVGSVSDRLAGITDDEAFRSALFQRLCDANILLVKYTFEALDVSSGGRLHSIHELYRMITSYVYPGEYITLPNFQGWIEWMAATGTIKMVGIRWGLSETGAEHLYDLKCMDVEEILEDLEEANLASEQESAATPTPVSPEVVETAPETSTGEDDLFADLPPEPERPSDAAVAAAEAAFDEEFKDVEENVGDVGTAPATLHWEELHDGMERYKTSRAKVPGGWLVATGVHTHEGASGICFMPDPTHKWDGSSLEG